MAERLRFDHRHGATPLPSQLKPRDVSTELKAKLWAGLHISMQQACVPRDYRDPVIGIPWRNLLYRWHVNIEHQPSDEFKEDFDYSVRRVRSLIYDADWARLYLFLEHIASSRELEDEREFIAHALVSARAAWRLIDSEIVPISSPEQAEAVGEAIVNVNASGPEGAKTHLRHASKLLATGDWPGSVRESIHAVEAVARTFEEAPTLASALKAMQRSGKPIHPALARGFEALYGYTSDEKGIRHALLDSETAAVGEAEALFMFGACASFCHYLLQVAAK